MATGKLLVYGTMDLGQFWPMGKSDADTTSMELIVDEDSFLYQESASAKAKATQAFDGALVRVKGQGAKEVIRTLKTTGARKITVRLQGVDAPELHLRAVSAVRRSEMTDEQKSAWDKVKGEYRQLQAETATLALAKHLGADDTDSIDVRFETYVEQPGDAIDAYGRFVGDVYILRNGKKDKNVNQWLVANGWAVAAFYNSMSSTEIKTLRKLAIAAKKKNARKFYDATTKFDRKLLYRSKPKNIDAKDHIDASADAGDFLLPKVFRRLTQYSTNKKAGLVSGSFLAYLESRSDVVYDVHDFLVSGPYSATPLSFHKQFHKGVLPVAPEDLVFHESKSWLVDENGTAPTWF